jgi:hypothetical protein
MVGFLSDGVIRLPIPNALAADFVSPADLGRVPPMQLTLGDHDLGQWEITQVEGSFSRQAGTVYVATLVRRG